MNRPIDQYGADAEWLEPDGLGGFASGTVSGARTRRYHALLLAAVTPPTGRSVLVNGCEVWMETASGTWPLSTQFYAPGVQHPLGVAYVAGFDSEPWPRWTFRLPDGSEVVQEILVPRGIADAGRVATNRWCRRCAAARQAAALGTRLARDATRARCLPVRL